MTRDAATQRAAELNGQEQMGRHWFVREREPGDYEVVAVNTPGLSTHGELHASIVAKPKPTEAPDPRPSLFRNIPPYGAG
jgi:hypothetical protein